MMAVHDRKPPGLGIVGDRRIGTARQILAGKVEHTSMVERLRLHAASSSNGRDMIARIPG
jgi:hypothetical protein